MRMAGARTDKLWGEAPQSLKLLLSGHGRFLFLFRHRDNLDIMSKLKIYFIMVYPDKDIGFRDNI